MASDSDYLREKPDSAEQIAPPVVTSLQLLPFDELGWDNFERLCLRLAEADGEVEYAGLYGVRGQDQQGIDVLVRLLGGTYRLIQCRRIDALTPTKIANAVQDFLDGKWAKKAREFVLATSASATRSELQDEIATQADLLGLKDIAFDVWDEDRLSRRLKRHGDLVFDFFGPAVRDAFLPQSSEGRYAASELAKVTIEQLLEDLGSRLEHVVRRESPPAPAPLLVSDLGPDTAEGLLDTLLAPEALASDLTRVFSDLRRASSREAAQLLAYVRDDPRRAHGLIQSPQPWVQKGSARLWNALGMLATAAGDWSDAERAFLRAEERADADDRALLLIRARDVAAAHGRDEDALRHFQRARELDAKAVAVRLIEIRGLDTTQERLAELHRLKPSNDRERTAIGCARVDALVEADDLAGALSAADEVLAHEPDSMKALDRRSGIVHMLAAQALSDGRDPDRAALRRAADDSVKLHNRLKVRNRTEESGRLLARAAECLALAGEFSGTLALVDEATDGERAHPDVRRALAQAAMHARDSRRALTLLGDEPDWDDDDRLMAARILSVLDTTDERRRSAELAGPLLADPRRREPAALAMLIAAAYDTDLEWPDEAATILGEAHPAVVAQLRAERLAAEGRSEEAERVLQAHADDVDVLRALVNRALEAERWGRALSLADRLVARTGSGEDRMRRAAALRGMGQTETLRQELTSLSANRDLPSDLRRRAFGALSSQLPNDDYGALEALTGEWLRALPGDRGAVWQRAFALARLARHPEALTLLDEHSFEPQDINQARLAAEIYFRALRGLEATRRIAALSDRFGREDEGLEALVLFSSTRTQEEAEGELRERIADTYRTFPERFPESTTIKAFAVPEDPDAMREFFETQLAARDTSEQRTAEERIANGEAPLATLAAFAHLQIAEVVPRLGTLPLAYGSPELDQRELECARAAIGGPAVWDPSSLSIVAGLPEPARSLCVGALPGSAVANSTVLDCDAAEARLDDRDEQHLLGVDDAGLRLTVVDTAEINRWRGSILGALELARTMTAVPDSDPAQPDPLDELIRVDDVLVSLNTWPATISIARRRGLPVFSDDRFIRVSALREQLDSFGTLALLTALHERGDLDDERLGDLRLILMRSGGVGLRASGQELATLASESLWEPAGRWLGALADPVGWRNAPDTRLKECIRFLRTVWHEREELLAPWTARVLDCAQRALSWNTHEFFARVMLIYTWMGAAPSKNDDEQQAFVAALLHAIDDSPALLGIASFHFPAERAIDLAMQASKAPRQLRTELFRHIVRQLPYPKSAEVVLAFGR
jgi:tetratricopeptide (TPR) repeat protein